MNLSLLLPLFCTCTLILVRIAWKRQRLFVIENGPLTATKSITTFCLATIVLVAMSIGSLYPHYRKAMDIQSHGRRAMAGVVGFTRVCGRGGCRYSVKYSYEAPDITRKIHRFAGIGGVRYTDLDYIRTSGQLPIAYAQDNPDQSSINLRDFAMTDQLPSFLPIIYGLVGFSVAGGIVAIAFSGMSLRRSKDLNSDGTAPFPFDAISARKRKAS
jgi:hypothetical protein